MFGVTLGGAMEAGYYRDKYLMFKSKVNVEKKDVFVIFETVCSGREHEFFYNPQDFYEDVPLISNYWRLQYFHPFRVFIWVTFFSGIILTPCLYALIYRRIWKQDKLAPGLSAEARQRRKNRNLVSMRFNLINWALDTLVLVLSAQLINRFVHVFFFLVNSCGTPVIYYLGIEDNRKQMKELYKNQFEKEETPDENANH